MPHVVLDSFVDLTKVSYNFEKIVSKEPCLIKIENFFVDKYKRIALLPTVVVEEKPQNFLIEILTGTNKTTIRLFPGTDPTKTPGVKTSLGLVTKSLQKIFPDAKITKTNIEDFLQANLIK